MKQVIIKLMIGLTFIFIFILSYTYSDIGKFIESKTYDARFDFRGKREPSKDIIIVSIDNVSMEELDSWPWPRDYHAKIVDILKGYGAKAVAFDVIFNKLSREPNNDKIFADSIKKADNVVLASMMIGGVYSKVSSSSNNVEDAMSYTAPDPYEEMLNGKIRYGLVNFQRDLDKNVRWGQLIYSLGDLTPSTQSIDNQWEPTFALQILKLYNPQKAQQIQEKYFDKKFLVNFAGPAHTYKTISFSNVLKGILLDNEAKTYNEVFKDKIVLIGATAEILHDTLTTPFTQNEQMPGVEVHAATIDTVMNGIEYKHASDFINNAIIILLGMIATLLFIYLNPFLGLGFVVLASVIYSAINLYLFIENRIWIDLTSPIGVMLFVFAGIYSYRFLIEEKEQRRVRGVFKRYMSPALVEEALRNPNKIPSLDICTKKFVTILFSDIAGFTTMSEKFPPEEVKRILDEYLTAMTDIVFANNGVLDKYIGDAVMAIYGNINSVDNADDAFRCVKTGIEMQEKMKDLRKKWVAEGSVAMQIRIGIHSGEALVGNFGSPLKMDYTVIGDTVNTAARLEGLNKEFSTGIIISQSTYELITNEIDVRSLGPVPVKGKSEAIHVYEVLGLSTEGKGRMVEDRNTKQTKWMRGNNKETKWARENNDTTWK
ncbi:MAG: adenylate/guanylate cyclase domain-containing protein [Candidatus Sericytochromatia bacterium]|nr:adenylate/guanylate cyclase domain-containing protein [Candidatus Sericytochromatia bacterium]